MEFTFKNKNTFWMQKDMTVLTGTRLHFYDLFWMSVYLNIPTTVDDAWLLYTRNFFLVHPCWLLQNSNFDFFRAFLFFILSNPGRYNIISERDKWQSGERVVRIFNICSRDLTLNLIKKSWYLLKVVVQYHIKVVSSPIRNLIKIGVSCYQIAS